jgi:hypothetical protein
MGLFDKLTGKRPSPDKYEKQNRPIHEAIDAVSRKDDPQTRTKLYKALLGGTFLLSEENFIPPTLGLPPGEYKIYGNEEAGVRLIEKDGEKILPVFTCEKSLTLYLERETKYTAIDSKNVFKIALDTGAGRIYVNPFKAGQKQVYFFGTLNRREMTALSVGLIPDPVPGGSIVPKGTEAFIGLPSKPYPAEWTNAFSARLKDFPQVRKAILYQVSYDTAIYEQKTPHSCMRLLIGPNADPQEAAGAMGKLFKEVSGGEGWIDISLTADENSFSETGKIVGPFYLRE